MNETAQSEAESRNTATARPPKPLSFSAKMRKRIMGNRIGEILISEGLITADELHAALVEQKRTKEPLGTILVRYQLITPAMLKQTLRKQMFKKFLKAGAVIFVCLFMY